jgi:hypothetical protein
VCIYCLSELYKSGLQTEYLDVEIDNPWEREIENVLQQLTEQSHGLGAESCKFLTGRANLIKAVEFELCG